LTPPLEGVRVVDLTHHITGPYCTKLLADYGADVIKVERPGGDPARRLAPFYKDEPHVEGSGLFLALNTNKRSAVIDLKRPAGREALLSLVRNADILVESFSPRVMPSLGLDYETLRGVNPHLTMTSISNFGSSGPYRDYKLSEIGLYAMGGTMYGTGMPDRPPVKLGLQVEQFFCGMVSATATLGAYLGNVFKGVAQHVDLSLFELMAGNQDRTVQAHATYQYTGVVNKRVGGGTGRNILPNGAYPCADGYVQFFAMRPVWKECCLMIDRPDLIDDQHYLAPENFAGNPERKAEVDAMVIEWCVQHTKREVMEKAQSVGYICGVLNEMDEVFADPHLEFRKYFTEIDHPYTGPLKYPGPQFRMAKSPARHGRAPLLGEHTDEVLQEAGYSVEDVAKLRSEGAVA
jgi:crotonobetainyl-CoA:carnitine CoA-transferase CaiB-like acyl-CoA transferase